METLSFVAGFSCWFDTFYALAIALTLLAMSMDEINWGCQCLLMLFEYTPIDLTLFEYTPIDLTLFDYTPNLFDNFWQCQPSWMGEINWGYQCHWRLPVKGEYPTSFFHLNAVRLWLKEETSLAALLLAYMIETLLLIKHWADVPSGKWPPPPPPPWPQKCALGGRHVNPYI